MKYRMKHIVIFLTGILLLSLTSGCEYDKPQSIYPIESAAIPLVNGIEPDSAFNGILDIRIIGQHFSSQADENFVYFGTDPGVVKSASETELLVSRSVKMSGPVMIQVVVRDAFLTDKFGPYTLEPGIFKIAPLGLVNSITLDNEENIYADLDNVIYKITPQGEQTPYGSIDFVSSAMKMGPEGALYIQRTNNRDLYKIAAGGGVGVRFTRIRRNVSCFDFGDNGFIYSGSEKYGLMVTSPDGVVSTETLMYANEFVMKAVRIFQGYVYVAADSVVKDPAPRNSGIWRHQIQSDGSVSPAEHVIDWDATGDFSQSDILDITFSQDGDMYVGTTNINPVLIIHPNGSMEPLYRGLIGTPASQLCWGGGNYLYVHRIGRNDDDSGVERIIMGKESAPYYGRP